METRKLSPLKPGERTCPNGKPVRNRILLLVPDEEYLSIRPHLKFLSMPHHLSLHHPHRMSKFVYFPNDGFISLVVEMKDGKTAEAGLLGNDGVAGIPAVMGLARSPLREIVQVAGSGFRVEIEAMRALLPGAPHLQAVLNRYAAGLAMQVAQTAACNRLHNVEKRLARWLLIAQDRMDSGLIPITHDFLATMLGTDRPSVSLAAAVLQKREIVRYTRGAVTILNRKALEAFACECYSVIRQYNGEPR
jgi:CRP-like cAMP-binding protein